MHRHRPGIKNRRAIQNTYVPFRDELFSSPVNACYDLIHALGNSGCILKKLNSYCQLFSIERLVVKELYVVDLFVQGEREPVLKIFLYEPQKVKLGDILCSVKIQNLKTGKSFDLHGHGFHVLAAIQSGLCAIGLEVARLNEKQFAGLLVEENGMKAMVTENCGFPFPSKDDPYRSICPQIIETSS